MADPRFTGSGVALVTPFDDRGVNEAVLRRLVRFQIDNGTDALIICGSTGEAATMSPAEQQSAIEIAVDEAAGAMPVIAGCGGSDTARVADLARNARAAGADAILASGPPYNKPTQQGLIAHFRALLDACDLPMVLYNVPGRSAVNILPDTMAQMAEDERVIGVKEASADISQIAEVARVLPERVHLWSGNDDQTVPIMALGGVGVISVLANVAPRETSRMAHAWLDGDTAESRRIQLELLPLIRALFIESNPIPVKTAVKWLGYDVGPLRLPMTAMTDTNRAVLIRALEAAGIRPGA